MAHLLRPMQIGSAKKSNLDFLLTRALVYHQKHSLGRVTHP